MSLCYPSADAEPAPCSAFCTAAGLVHPVDPEDRGEHSPLPQQTADLVAVPRA